jgi:GxxExxY protein
MINNLSERILGAAIEVHRTLGPGLLESTYEKCLAKEFSLRGLSFEEQRVIPLSYKGLELGGCYRLDFLVSNLNSSVK